MTSLDAQRTYVMPDQNAQVARAIFPRGNPVMRLYDDLHLVVADRDFADLSPARGQPAEAPVRLALATLLQFVEGLTDCQVSDAVRTWIDWRYLLCLELTDPGFSHAPLSDLRTRLLAHGAQDRLFEAVLDVARGRGTGAPAGHRREPPDRPAHPRHRTDGAVSRSVRVKSPGGSRAISGAGVIQSTATRIEGGLNGSAHRLLGS